MKQEQEPRITDGKIRLDRFTRALEDGTPLCKKTNDGVSDDEDEDDGCDAEWVMQTMAARDADADDHDGGEGVDEPMVLLCRMVKSPVGLMDFELCSFFWSQRIKKLFDQLDISTEDVRELFILIDLDQDENVVESEFTKGIMWLRGPAKTQKLLELQLGS